MRRYITKKISVLERDCGDLARRCDHFREQVAAPCGTTLALLLTRVQSSNALAVAEELRLMLVRAPAQRLCVKPRDLLARRCTATRLWQRSKLKPRTRPPSYRCLHSSHHPSSYSSPPPMTRAAFAAPALRERPPHPFTRQLVARRSAGPLSVPLCKPKLPIIANT